MLHDNMCMSVFWCSFVFHCAKGKGTPPPPPRRNAPEIPPPSRTGLLMAVRKTHSLVPGHFLA